MPFIVENGSVVSFADYQDVINMDDRLFAINEGITSLDVENTLIRSTIRILNKLKASDWWKAYSGSSIPDALDVSSIVRTEDFTDLCVYFAMFQYILPKLANFDESSADYNKIEYYRSRFTELFEELLVDGDWYDADASGTVTSTEVQQSAPNLHLQR